MLATVSAQVCVPLGHSSLYFYSVFLFAAVLFHTFMLPNGEIKMITIPRDVHETFLAEAEAETEAF